MKNFTMDISIRQFNSYNSNNKK